MTRVKRGTTSLKRRRSVLKSAKGYRFGRGTKERQAKEAVTHAGVHAYVHRKDKKGVFRRLWSIKINASIRKLGMNYSQLIGSLNKKNIGLNRKMLSEIAHDSPDTFKRVVSLVKYQPEANQSLAGKAENSL